MLEAVMGIAESVDLLAVGDDWVLDTVVTDVVADGIEMLVAVAVTDVARPVTVDDVVDEGF